MPLKVLMFGWEFPPHNSGGLGTACEGLSRALVRQGAEIIFVLPKVLPLADPSLKIVFADIDRFGVRRVPGLLYPYVTSQDYLSRRLGLPAGVPYGWNLLEEVFLYAKRAEAIAQEEDFDLIHAHDWLSYPAGLMAKRVSGKPLIVHVHATEYDRSGSTAVNPEVFKIERAGMEGADGVITVSGFTKEMVGRYYGVPPHKISVVHNGGNPTSPRPPPSQGGPPGGEAGLLERLKAAGNKIVLFVGRVTLQKGPDYFVQVAQRVFSLRPRTRFVLAGDGDMMGQIMAAVAGAGISDRFIFTGFLRGEELERVYRAADLYLLPSVSEPFGITPLEALANGTPVLVSKQSGVSEVLTHALKVDFWDIDEMANQIVAVLDYPSLHRVLAEYGQKEAARVTWTAAAGKCLDFYRQFVTVG